MITFYRGAKGKRKEREIAESFAIGFGAEIKFYEGRGAGSYPCAFYGVTEITNPLYQAVVRDGGEHYYVDNGYFGHGEYYRITKNAPQHTGIGPGSAERFAAHGLKIKPWRTDGNHVLVTTQSEWWYIRHGTTLDDWVRSVTDELRAHTDREIRVRTKPKSVKSPNVPFGQDLENAWAVVTHSSNTAVDAILDGVPAFVTHPCAALAMGNGDLSKIETPHRPDGRQEWAECLAANQWTRQEIATGMARSWVDGHR